MGTNFSAAKINRIVATSHLPSRLNLLTMNWLMTNLIAALLLPPLNLLLLLAVGLVLLRRKPRLGKLVIMASVALLWIFSTPVVGSHLLALLARGAHTPVEQMRDAQAIVVLGGGTYPDALEYGGETVGVASLERLRLAARLQHRTGLPVLVTGGNPDGGQYPEAVLMKKVLEEEFSVPVRWVETASNNTRENAANSRAVLASEGVHTIVLVTHGWHMPRAQRAFEKAGFQVLPAGTGFHGGGSQSLLNWMPSAFGLHTSAQFVHEAIGLLWYRLKG